MENSINDPQLGELKRIDAFSHGRHVTVDGRDVLVAIDTGEGLTPEALAQAQKVVASPADFAGRAKRYASEGLLDLKNETWSGDEPRALSAHELEQRLALQACEIAADGVATLYFDDGGLFGGHSVVVYVGSDGDLSDVKLAG